jgi:peptide/nickel transport system substrate-binding protein
MQEKSGIRRWLIVQAAGLLVTSTISGTSVDAKPKDTLRIVYPIEPVNMNPVKQANNFGNFWEAISEPLVKPDYNFQLTGDGIITTWRQKSPGVWRFTLRPGLKFTNGESLDAAAVGFTMTTYRDTIGVPMRAYLLKVQSTTVVGKTVLEATFSAGDLSTPAVLSSVRALPPTYYAQAGHDGFGANPVGSGPYKFKSWAKGVELRLVRNEDYWGKPANIKNLAFTFAADGDTRANLLASGAVDFAHPISVQRCAGLRNDATTVVKAADRVQLALFLMGNKPQLSDIRLREAVVRSIDVEPIAENVLLKKGGVPNCSLLLPLLNKPEFPACPKRDVAKARSSTAKFANPTITLNCGPSRAPADANVVQALAAQLREVGFTVNLNPMDYQKMTVDLV